MQELDLGPRRRDRPGPRRRVEHRLQEGRRPVVAVHQKLLRVGRLPGEEVRQGRLVAEHVDGIRPRAGEDVVEQPVVAEARSAGRHGMDVDEARVPPEHGALGQQGACAVDYGQRFGPPSRARQLDRAIVGRHRRLGRGLGRQLLQTRFRQRFAVPPVQREGPVSQAAVVAIDVVDRLAQHLQGPVGVDVEQHDVAPAPDRLLVQRLAVEAEHRPDRNAASPAGAVRHHPGMRRFDSNRPHGARRIEGQLADRRLPPAPAAELPDLDHPRRPPRRARFRQHDRGPEPASVEPIAGERKHLPDAADRHRRFHRVNQTEALAQRRVRQRERSLRGRPPGLPPERRGGRDRRRG